MINTYDNLVELLDMDEKTLKDTLANSPNVIVLDLRKLEARIRDLESKEYKNA